MERVVSEMLRKYEQGKIGRRYLVAALAAMVGRGPGTAATAPFKGVALNHIALRVREVPRSREFYSNLLGLRVTRSGDTSSFLELGNGNFLALFHHTQPGLDHYCIAVEDFSADAIVSRLNQEGLSPRRPAGTDRVYFQDPDGIEVQFSAVNHRA